MAIRYRYFCFVFFFRAVSSLLISNSNLPNSIGNQLMSIVVCCLRSITSTQRCMVNAASCIGISCSARRVPSAIAPCSAKSFARWYKRVVEGSFRRFCVLRIERPPLCDIGQIVSQHMLPLLDVQRLAGRRVRAPYCPRRPPLLPPFPALLIDRSIVRLAFVLDSMNGN
jgi:hypothetical protein